MVVDGNTFLRRAQHFFRDLQANRYPNSSTLAEACKCSPNTAQRTIYRLRDEHLMPIEYDASEKGYYLRDPNWVMPAMLPPGKDELTSLLLAKDLVRHLDAEDLNHHLDALCSHFSSSNSSISRELNPLSQFFSADSTVVADIADQGVLNYVECAKRGESIELEYKSPWRHTEKKKYKGRIARVHYSDGSLYILFREETGRELVLNTAFIKSFTKLDYSVPIADGPEDGGKKGSENWLDGFGVWAGDALEEIEIKIGPPAAEYYAAQRWHVDQIDTWEGDILVRSFPGIVSPELVRRVLSLGRFVAGLKPQSLVSKVVEDSWMLTQRLHPLGGIPKVS